MKCSKCWLYDLSVDVCLNSYHRSGILCGEKDVSCRAMRAVMKLARKMIKMDCCPSVRQMDACDAQTGRSRCVQCWSRWTTR